jgi:hypothetical protein
MRKIILLLTACLLLGGCMPTPANQWVARYTPTTDAERKAVAEHVERVMASTPRTLAGHDQDWDDALKMAYNQARQTLCRETLWERAYIAEYTWEDTGHWRYADDGKVEK